MSERLDESGIESTTVSIMRTSATVKGGRRFSFAALVVVGDRQGSIGLGHQKSGQVPQAIEKSQREAKRKLRKYPTTGSTIPHAVEGRFGACKVLLLPASPGTGVVAGAAVRAPLEMLGIRDCMTKCHGSSNTLNIVKAVFNGLEQLKSREEIEAARGRTLGHSDTEIQQKLDKPAPVSTEGDADAETPEAPAEAAANEATAS